MTDPDEAEERGGYERWLDGLAGERVKTLPIFVMWVLVIGVTRVALPSGSVRMGSKN